MKRKHTATPDLASRLGEILIGQSQAIATIIPYVEMYQAGLNPAGRPAGVFLLTGPTGSGKTQAVEGLAQVLHGSPANVLRVDCGEYQMEHEMTRLLGSPPGYLGHRETSPVFTEGKLAAVRTSTCRLAIILFDEIEKAAASFRGVLLGVMDKGTLRTGDGQSVNFQHSMIFLTSNLGAAAVAAHLRQGYGFASQPGDPAKAKCISERAVSKKFSPEFINRLDATVVFNRLTDAELGTVLDRKIEELQHHIAARLGVRGFSITLTRAARTALLTAGTSAEFGGREINRAIHRMIMTPVAQLVVSQRVPAGATIRVDADGATLRMRVVMAGLRAAA